MWRAESSAQGQAAAPIAEEVRAFEFVIDGALGIAAGRGREHPQSVARELVEMVMRGTAGDGAAEAERKRLAEAAEELEGLTPEADVGAEIIVDVIALRLLRAGDRGLVVDREAYVQA